MTFSVCLEPWPLCEYCAVMLTTGHPLRTLGCMHNVGLWVGCDAKAGRTKKHRYG